MVINVLKDLVPKETESLYVNILIFVINYQFVMIFAL